MGCFNTLTIKTWGYFNTLTIKVVGVWVCGGVWGSGCLDGGGDLVQKRKGPRARWEARPIRERVLGPWAWHDPKISAFARVVGLK